MPPVTPAFTAPLTSSTALTLLPSTTRSPPVVFLKPKVPLMVTKPATWALRPLTMTAVSPMPTMIGAETLTPATLMVMVWFTATPVLL